MSDNDKVTKKNLPRILDLLNKALNLEYSLIVHYPRLASTIQDEDTKVQVQKLGSASIKHADVVANAISKLGGIPFWSFNPYPETANLVKTFQVQLEKEKLALQLHQQSTNLVQDSSLRYEFEKIAKEEEGHIRIVEEILSRLTQGRESS